jgi:hypothetical protein
MGQGWAWMASRFLMDEKNTFAKEKLGLVVGPTCLRNEET